MFHALGRGGTVFGGGLVWWGLVLCCAVPCIRAEPEMEGLLCDLLWADPSDDPGVTNIESLSDQVYICRLIQIGYSR